MTSHVHNTFSSQVLPLSSSFTLIGTQFIVQYIRSRHNHPFSDHTIFTTLKPTDWYHIHVSVYTSHKRPALPRSAPTTQFSSSLTVTANPNTFIQRMLHLHLQRLPTPLLYTITIAITYPADASTQRYIANHQSPNSVNIRHTYPTIDDLCNQTILRNAYYRYDVYHIFKYIFVVVECCVFYNLNNTKK